MIPLYWRRSPLAQRLSAYLDGELDEREATITAEDLIFDIDARQLLRAYRQIDHLVGSSLAPARRPDPEAVSECLQKAFAAVDAPPAASRPPSCSKRRHIKPAAILASIGLVVTASVALAGLRRRGLV